MICRYILRLYRLAAFHVKHGGSLSIPTLAQHARWCLAHLDECAQDADEGRNDKSWTLPTVEAATVYPRGLIISVADVSRPPDLVLSGGQNSAEAYVRISVRRASRGY